MNAYSKLFQYFLLKIQYEAPLKLTQPIQLELPFPNNSSIDKQENNFVKKEENFFDGTGIANYDFYILSKTKYGKLEDI